MSKRHKSCNGCKALDVDARSPCTLQFLLKKEPFNTPLGVAYRYVPLESCPKPKRLMDFVSLSMKRS